MRGKFNQLLKAARQTCQLCRIAPNEKVVVFADTGRDEQLPEAFYVAASEIASATMVIVEPFPVLTNPPDIAVNAMREADMVFDLASSPWLYTEATERILAANTRMLQVISKSAESIIERPPERMILDREKKAYDLLKSCKSVRIKSDTGTDLRMVRGNRRIHTQGGCVDEPATWDSYGISLAAFAPLEDGADGVVFIEGSIFALPEFMVVNEPIRLDISKGKITNVEGSTWQKKYFATWLESWKDPNSYVISHTGFGLDHRVKNFSSEDPGAPESMFGAINIAFGSNMFRLLGGANKAPSHTDIILLNHDFYIDDRKIIEKGKFVADSGIA